MYKHTSVKMIYLASRSNKQLVIQQSSMALQNAKWGLKLYFNFKLSVAHAQPLIESRARCIGFWAYILQVQTTQSNPDLHCLHIY